MNKILTAIVVGIMTTTAVAGPCGGRGCGWGGGCRPHRYDWNHGGRQDFWTGFAVAAIGTVVGNIASARTAYAAPAVAAQPVAVAQPAYAQQAYAQPVAAQPVAYQQPVAAVPAANYGYAGVNTNPYPNSPIVAPAGAVVTGDQPIAGRTRVWVQGTYAHKLQGNGTYATQYIPGHYEYQ